jgi:glycosyltransferase involved in cell wall biosynthesis
VVRRPNVSVIIPVYNDVEFLGQAIQSALDQNLPKEDLEIVVVDDGSTADVRGPLAPFSDTVVYVRQDNNGPAAARNRGVASSRGAHVAFLDSDDYWLAGRLSAMLALAAECSPALITTDFYYETRGVRAEQSRFVQNDRLWFFDLPADEQYPRALEESLFSSMTFMPRALFDELGGFNPVLRFAEDYEFAVRALSRGIPIRMVKQPLAVYRYLRPGASTTVSSPEKAWSLLQTLEAHGEHVSRARLENVRNTLAYLRFREALKRRAWFSMLLQTPRLATRPRFCIERLQARRTWTQIP